MSKVRLREAAPTNDNGVAPTQGLTLKPLKVSGIVVGKADLIEALRVYIPGLSEIQVTEDGETFILSLGEGSGSEDPAAR